MICYKVGAIGWKLATYLGMPLKVTVKVGFDPEAQVYIAYSDSFEPYLGIGTEAPTYRQLKAKLVGLFEDAMVEAFGRPMKNRLIFNFRPWDL